ncbi:hypothetical protein [Labilibaculum sp.]|uniref:hypothetical protein n=1 Tax=Labilibaculum sp. TaxID=2060723 RepID=UPI00356B27CF
MNKLTINTLKVLRKLYAKTLGKEALKKPECDQDPDSVSQKIYEALMADEPCMIARFGGFELSILVNYLGVQKGPKNIINYIKGNELDWWWNEKLIGFMNTNAGFFPPTVDKIEEFCELMVQDIKQVNILGSWLPEERIFSKELGNCKKINFELLNPYFSKNPWTKALEGKKVLVVHPFVETIEQQYQKRELLFENNLLPAFELKTIKAVQSIAGEKTEFNDWFEALDYMKSEIDKVDYDICLIGAGAYGFALAAHVKRMGKKSIHLGGSLQLLFGIRGKRWEDENYNPTYNYARLINEHWVKPGDKEKPKGAAKVESSCYW